MNIDKLTKETILQKLNDKASFFDVNIFDTVTSTNTLAKEEAINGAREGYVVLATSQTQGRGRIGRKFFSPSDTGIYLSVVLKPDEECENMIFITTLAAVSVCEAIESVSQKKTDIKWVNDIFIDGKKVCGILSEAKLKNNNKPEFVILGIGINVYKPEYDFPDDIAKTAGYIFEQEEKDVKNNLCAKILERILFYYNSLKEKAFLDEYKKRSIATGKNITVIKSNKKYSAYCMGLDDDLRLKVRYENGNEDYVSSGEISIRLN